MRRIHILRGIKVMLDADLAALYDIETGNLNKAVSRNIERFPSDFMFQLTLEEHESLRFQIGSLKRGAHAKYLPRVFTQEGVAMLSGVLRSERAVQTNIAIMRAFVRLRLALATDSNLAERMKKAEQLLDDHDFELDEHGARINDILAAMQKRGLT